MRWILAGLLALACTSAANAQSATGNIYSNGFGGRGPVQVRSYVRQNGTFVPSHYRTAPDSTRYNNWSQYPNRNPYTGQRGYRR